MLNPILQVVAFHKKKNRPRLGKNQKTDHAVSYPRSHQSVDTTVGRDPIGSGTWVALL